MFSFFQAVAAPVSSSSASSVISVPAPENEITFDLAKFIIELAAAHPYVATILAVVGVLRLVNKPIFSLVHMIVDSTPSPKDNEILGAVEGSSIYKTISYVLDWFGSIKIPKK